MFIQDFYSNIHDIDTSIPQFATYIRRIRIVVTPHLISEVLHVPRVVHPDYPGYEHLRIVSNDEMIFAFCGHLVDWGDR